MPQQKALILALIGLSCLAHSNTTYATTPIPKSKTKSLQAFQDKLEQEKNKQSKLNKTLKNVQKDLEATQNQLVTIGQSVQNNEKELQNLEHKIIELSHEKKEIQENLHADKTSLSRLILALSRLERIPPQALIVKPETPIKTAQSAMLLHDILPTLNNRAEDLRTKLENLTNIEADLQDKKARALKKSQTLKTEQKQLATLLDKRKKLTRATQKDLKKQQKEIQIISAQAKNLKDLVEKIDTRNKRSRHSASLKKALANTPSFTQSNSKGGSRLPVSGIIRVQYKELDKFGAPSEGIRIEGRAQGLVVAPMNGTIRFAGPFKNYGQMIIIEHPGRYHSLLGGLDKVDISVGQHISAGEPLGTLKASGGSSRPVLYYELRRNGKPVNPALKLDDLG